MMDMMLGNNEPQQDADMIDMNYLLNGEITPTLTQTMSFDSQNSLLPSGVLPIKTKLESLTDDGDGDVMFYSRSAVEACS